jgi:hypothetical protein
MFKMHYNCLLVWRIEHSIKEGKKTNYDVFNFTLKDACWNDIKESV